MRRYIFIATTLLGLTIIASLAGGLAHSFRDPPPVPKATITIPEGFTVRDINKKLAEEGVLHGEELSPELEGYLFPDTYEFFIPSGSGVVREKFRSNFDSKILPLLPDDISDIELKKILTVASLIEKEVFNFEDRRVVSGIIWKRLRNDIPLQVDASLCYTKGVPCLPITDEDKRSESLYNTYQYRGLPPGPISNPGVDAVLAALDPEESPYWYYLSDPATGDTVFAKTLDEHNNNVVKYLGN